jgi:hypothetical protein
MNLRHRRVSTDKPGVAHFPALFITIHCLPALHLAGADVRRGMRLAELGVCLLQGGVCLCSKKKISQACTLRAGGLAPSQLCVPRDRSISMGIGM